MTGKTQILINAALIIAVALLYYFHFTSCKATCEIDAEDTVSAKNIMSQEEIKSSKIVYVNSDILNENYDFVRDLTTAAQTKQQRLENAYQTKAQKFQQDYTELQQKANQGLLSENQGIAAQKDLEKRKDELDKMEMQLQTLMEEIQKSNEEVRKTVIDYVKEYNKKTNYNFILTHTEGPGGVLILANDSLDITNEILEGLNAEYKAKKELK